MHRLFIVYVFMTVWLVVSCSASDPYTGTEDVTYGTWRGTLTPTGAETIDISYVIKQQATRTTGENVAWTATFGNAGQILLPSSEAEGGEQQIEMVDLDWDGTTLEYSWTDPQGTKLSCALVIETDTRLSGDCVDSDGGTRAQMTMSPPAGKVDSN